MLHLLSPCNYLVSICDQLWEIKMTWCWPYAVRSSNMFEKRLQKCLGVPGTSSFRKKNEKKGFFLRCTERPDHCWPFWRPVVGGDTLSPLAPALGPEQKTGDVTLFPLFMAVRMILNMWRSSGHYMRHSWLTHFRAFCPNQPVPSVSHGIGLLLVALGCSALPRPALSFAALFKIRPRNDACLWRTVPSASIRTLEPVELAADCSKELVYLIGCIGCLS